MLFISKKKLQCGSKKYILEIYDQNWIGNRPVLNNAKGLQTDIKIATHALDRFRPYQGLTKALASLY